MLYNRHWKGSEALMCDIHESFCKADRERKLVKELIELIGAENTRKIVQMYGGNNIYIPKCEKSAFQKRDYEIYHQFLAGISLKELGKRYGLTERNIRNIVHNIENDTQTLRDPERNKGIRTDFENGMAIRSIAHKYKLSETFIRTIIENDKL
ncbi:MAG: Mor transcription activator family protein [Ruminococcus sp.]